MKKVFTLGFLLLLIILPVWAFAGEYTLVPSEDSDLGDLDHYYYYTWYLADDAHDSHTNSDTDIDRILSDLVAGESIVSASLTFTNIRNHNADDFDLYVHLLDEVPSGNFNGDVDSYNSDYQGWGDFFAGNSTFGDEALLVHYYAYFDGGTLTEEGYVADGISTGNMPYGEWWEAETITYSFGDEDLANLTDFMQDGTLGIGLDPDCHFYNNGVSLTITTEGSGSDGENPVPEPATAVLLGAGLIGLAMIRRQKHLA